MKHCNLTKMLFFLLGFFFVNYSYAQEKVPIKILKSGHIILKAKINGIEGNFIFDTGAGITVLTKEFSTKLHNIEKQDGVLTAFRATGERQDVDLYTVNDLRIGDLVEKKPTVTIIDINLLNYDGIISLIPFQKQPFTLDLQNKLFILETPQSILKRKSDGKSISLHLDQNRGISLDIFANFILNDKKKLQFLLDSGAGENSFWINSRYLSACGRDTTDTANVKKIIKKSEFDKEVETVFYRASVPKLILKDYSKTRLENFSAVFTKTLIYDGKVSIGWLGNQITFDLKNKEMIVKK